MITEITSIIMRQAELMDRINKSRSKIDHLLDRNDPDKLCLEAENFERLLNIFKQFHKDINQKFCLMISKNQQPSDIIDIANTWFTDTNSFILKTNSFYQELIKALELSKNTIVNEISKLNKGIKTLHGYSLSSVK